MYPLLSENPTTTLKQHNKYTEYLSSAIHKKTQFNSLLKPQWSLRYQITYEQKDVGDTQSSIEYNETPAKSVASDILFQNKSWNNSKILYITYFNDLNLLLSRILQKIWCVRCKLCK